MARADGRHDHLHDELTNAEVFTQTSFREPALSSASQAGLVNNLNDGLAWGLFPILFSAAGLSVGEIGILAALYPAVWGAGQLVTGALSDRIGRKWLIAAGMWVQAIALAGIALGDSFGAWAVAAVLLGAGTAMVYPTLLAAIGDVAHPAWRASGRSGSTASGVTAASQSVHSWPASSPTPSASVAAVWTVAALTAASGVVVAVRMYETHHRPSPAHTRDEPSMSDRSIERWSR